MADERPSVLQAAAFTRQQVEALLKITAPYVLTAAEIIAALGYPPVAPADPITALSMSGAPRLAGRYTAGLGPVQEITLGSGLSLSGGGVLSATGTGGTVTSVGLSTSSAGITLGGTNPVTGAGTIAVNLSANLNSWSAIAPSAKQDTLGYAPVNKSGDTMTGTLEISNTLPRLVLTDTDGTGGGFRVNGATAWLYGAGATSFLIRPLGDAVTTGQLDIRATSITWDGHTLWHAGNFDPASKVDTNSPTFQSGYFSMFPYSPAHIGTQNGRVQSYVTETSYAKPTWYMRYIDSANAIVPMDLRVNGGVIATDGFSGPLAGNASTASALATARTISLTGDVTGSVSFNGSANVSITATVANNSHTHAIANITDLPAISVNESASSIVQRDASGYIQNSYFNTSAAATATSPTAVFVETGSDGYIRKQTLANLRTNMAAVENVSGVAQIQKITQSAYDALGTKDADTLYVIVG